MKLTVFLRSLVIAAFISVIPKGYCAVEGVITVGGKEISLESLPVYHCHLSPAVVCVDGIFYYLFKNYLLLRDETAEPYLAAAVTYCRNPELRKTGEDDTPLPGWKLKGSYDYIPPYYSGKVDIPEKITYQGYEFTVDMVSLHAFDQSYGLKEVNLPSTVREFAFTDCCYTHACLNRISPPLTV